MIADRFFPPEQKSELRMCTNFTLVGIFFFFLRNQYAPPPTLERLDFPG